RRHSSQVETQSGLKWVGASGIQNAEKITITPTMRFQASSSKEKLEIPVLGPEDDAEEATDGKVSLTSSDLELIRDETDQIVGMRFQDLQIFQGGKIKNAYVQFTVDEPDVEEKKKEDPKAKEEEKKPEEKLLVRVENVGHASSFAAENHNLSKRPLTEKPVEWKPKPWKKEGDHGEDQRTPNIAPLLQVIVDREDWRFGNAVAILIKGEGKRVAHAFDKDPKNAPKLVIELEGVLPRVLIGAKEDDAEEAEDGAVALASSDLEMTKDEAKHQVIGMRFRKMQIPRNKVLEAAYLQFTVKDPSETPADLVISIEDDVDPPQYKNEKGNISGRKTTSTMIHWSPEPWTEKDASGKAQRTPNLAPLIQEIVNREDWKPGNALSFIVSGTGHRSALSFDGKKEKAPKLFVKFSPYDVAEIDLADAPRFTVRLHFFDPEQLPVGQRIFNVALQGKPALQQFDIAAHLLGEEQLVIKEFKNIPIPLHLDIEFQRASGTEAQPPVLSGIELIQESTGEVTPVLNPLSQN
ncbi:MAG: malectin domain-containing carbohydrate-binding protein, partial [Verrucomicrobiales bacterium]